MVTEGLKPPNGAAGAPAPLVDPITLAESYGYGYYKMETVDDYNPGTGAHTGDMYQWLDQTTSQHVGTLTGRAGSATADLPVAFPGTDVGFFRCTGGTGERLWTNTPPVNHKLGFVLIFRFPDATADISRYFFGHETGTADRPFGRLNNVAAGSWALQGTGGGSDDAVLYSEGNNISTQMRISDQGWHCIALHWGKQAFEGLMFDIDGEVLIPDNSSFTVADIASATIYDSLWMLGPGFNAGGAYTAPENMDIAAFAHCIDTDLQSHAQTRELASAMMTKYGITPIS